MVGEWRLSVPRGAGAVVPAVCGIVEACEAEAEVERVGRGFTEMKAEDFRLVLFCRKEILKKCLLLHVIVYNKSRYTISSN